MERTRRWSRAEERFKARETPISASVRAAVIGTMSEFDRCTIYWSPATPASIVYGAIRDAYRSAGGPLGDIGFPTNDEADIPGAAGGRFNAFQAGSILWFSGPIFVCRPFTIRLGRLDTKEVDRDFLDLDGQNDLYVRVSVDVNGGRVFDRKYPESASPYPPANIRDLAIDVPYTVVPNAAGVTARVTVQVWESDEGTLFAGGDDHLGAMTSNLDITNAWGLRAGTNGLFTASNFGPWINSLDWSVKPRATANTPFDFWGVTNRGTATPLPWRDFAAAFSDVDPDPEFDFGIPEDALRALYYEAVVKGLPSGGNCVGMSLEAIYAWKDQSRLGRPLSRFGTWGQVENDFNIRHVYQVGADAIWWVVGQFLSGNTHDPVGVFQATWDSFARGENPVICIAQNYDFSGGPHCILPVSWNRNVTPWQLGVFDPNFQNSVRFISVDPATNSFSYTGAGRNYSGDAWSGGRFHYLPWSVVNHRQRTPVWDAILLVLGGVVVLFGEATDIDSLTDENGNDLTAESATSRAALEGKLINIPGTSGDGPVAGSLRVGRANRPRTFFNTAALVDIRQRMRDLEVPDLAGAWPGRVRCAATSPSFRRSVHRSSTSHRRTRFPAPPFSMWSAAAASRSFDRPGRPISTQFARP